MGDDEKKGDDCVKVAIRCRPLSNKETGNNESSIVQMQESVGGEPGGITITDPDGKEKPAQFAFDIVFDTDSKQEAVYETVGHPAIESTLAGYNGTIFAYGQTGSGKSWCMSGGSGDLRGIIPRVNEALFKRIETEQESIPTRKFLVVCSFFEIYNEIIFDLLNPVQDRSKLGAGLQVKEHPVLGIYVKDLQDIVVTDADKLEKLMASGIKNRAVSSTMMNSTSSRSHSIFTVKVHQKDDEDKSKNVFAKLNLVDLAGSERQKGTGATGQTLKEGANINKSLSALGNVINALVENANGKKVFVPYRNSKLTRVLQESLGGNSLCTMLATLSPAACNYEETLSTLRYANRAKAIKVAATKNEEASQISRLNAEIEELKKKLVEGDGAAGGGASGLLAEEERAEIKAKFQAQLKDMESMISSTWEEKSKLSQEQEAALNRLQEEQKRQARALEEECRKRFRLLQEQNDLELTIRGLADILQSLPSKANGSSASSSSSSLISGDLPRDWLRVAEQLSEGTDQLKQQQTMAVVFQGAFSEDLRLWIDGGEGGDTTMARTGARRALKKVETLKKECERVAVLEKDGKSKASSFTENVAKARAEWLSSGAPAVIAEFTSQQDDQHDSSTVPENGQKELPVHLSRALEDIGQILQLVEQQAQARVTSFSSLGSMEMKSPAELVLKGMGLVLGAKLEGSDEMTLKSLWARQNKLHRRELPAVALHGNLDLSMTGR
jgi:kinesin family protein 1/kinesin family protein 3/17